MEKRNVIEQDRTPDMSKQASADDFERQAVDLFAPPVPKYGGKPTKQLTLKLQDED